MKLLIFICLLLVHPAKYHELEWSDYKGIPVGLDAARTTTEISIERKQEGNVFSFNVWCQFVPHESFTRTSSLYVLEHEKLHMAVTEIYTGRILAICSRPGGYDLKESHAVKSNINAILDEWNETQERYDAETRHSADTAAQERWVKMIKLQLKEYVP